jgi:hypothetical protein
VDAFITARADALSSKLPLPPFPQGQAFASAGVLVWRIHVVARTADGVTFARDAVVRLSNDPRRPVVTLLWKEGASETTLESSASVKPAQDNGTGKP